MKKICVLVGVLISLVVTGIVAMAKQSQMQEELAKEVFRFHVLANSDNEADQALKLKVKEEVIAYMQRELPYADSVDTTKQWAEEHLQTLEMVAQKVVYQEGYKYPVSAQVTTCDFPEKTYGDVTFPPGKYEALRIEIGKAQGQNWWCVLYPNLCFLDAVHAVVPDEGKRELRKVLEEDTYEMVTATTRFKIRWFFF